MATGHDHPRTNGPNGPGRRATEPPADDPTHPAAPPPADGPGHRAPHPPGDGGAPPSAGGREHPAVHPPAHSEYRIAHLEERLARSDLAELGMRIEARGDAVHITGTASTAAVREAILRLAAEELPGVPVRADITLADVTAPDRPEELS
ncbi:BON domain-containing protein [Streptomyces sp. 11x1]|uniref:BON domain-containing protein n=1 Tax=Streptomyces sp. 11x1 TaxID=3038642 RepID=UPI0029312AFB|nr:BON domain-containing protein [Streptomyces sp. 11x1]